MNFGPFDHIPKSGALLDLPGGETLFSAGDSTWSDNRLASKPCYFLPFFFRGSPARWLSFAENHVCSSQELKSNDQREKAPSPIDWDWSEPEKEKFAKTCSFIFEQFEFGLKKVVPTVVSTSPYSDSKKAWLLSRLLESSPGLSRYGFWLADQGLVGKSPEILVSYQKKRLSTMALAGTARVGAVSAEDFLQDPKERHEHQLVIDGIRQSLEDLGKVQVGETSVLQIPPLMHLKTEIFLEDVDCEMERVVEMLHPTPALGVFPRERADLLEKVSARPRGRFGAPFGVWFNENHWHLLVAIRNFEFDQNRIFLQSGCGIVSQSLPDKEWLELKNKRAAVLATFGVL